MMENKILERIRIKQQQFDEGNNDIYVLKGIPLSIVDSENIYKMDLEKAVDNKISYLNKYCANRKYITFEEFLLMQHIVTEQYKNVYVLNNNLYMNLYPIYANFSDKVLNGLLNHFSDNEEVSDDISIGDIQDYIALFDGLSINNGNLIGSYCDENVLNNSKVYKINLFDEVESKIKSEENYGNCVEIFDENDYLELIKRLNNKPDVINLKINNFIGNTFALKLKLGILSSLCEEWTEIFIVQTKTQNFNFEHREEFTSILKKYWGYSKFRDIPVYDMSKLDEGEKEITYVSQENIISNVVQQVENCSKEIGDHRDIFVTAPTGAGKSVMFQIPAIYLAEKYNFLTIVISPLIGLMNDQVKSLEVKKYRHAKTINSDISPIIKQEITEKVANGDYHILYISPETLLSRSDVNQLIGDRTIGMIIIDEAHIVTTWGKQFRPDYWYLGDHIKKLRKKQLVEKKKDFVIATFTATAIYRGLEDMYTETKYSLHMANPITYLGYIKRKDILIKIEKTDDSKKGRQEYELDKFDQFEEVIKRALITRKKTLIYFPTVALIGRCFDYFRNKNMISNIAIYHGSLEKDKKEESYEKFLNKEKLIMFATKAFGMGIDIKDIELIVHLAPTGNVCDYLQEIGRAAREDGLTGEAFYQYKRTDFKHINRLHGLSMIQNYQLVEVIKKIEVLYKESISGINRRDYTRKRNAMLLDADNFSYIFGNPISDEDDNINKVKTALLIIQKDFENKKGFSPFNVRPIPLFSVGFFQVEYKEQSKLLKKYPECLTEIEHDREICRINLNQIWEKKYKNYSFPAFKYLVYSRSPELSEFVKLSLKPALCVNISYADDYKSDFVILWNKLSDYFLNLAKIEKYTEIEDICENIMKLCKFNKYKAQTVCEVLISSMESYRKKYATSTAPLSLERTSNNGEIKYQFTLAVETYFSWIKKGYRKVEKNTLNGELYLVYDNEKQLKEYNIILGVLESINILSFKMLGGANSQLYIYINQIQALENVVNAPSKYKNRLLETVSERHLISVKMLTYIYEGGFESEKIWDLLEDYFLGKIPESVKLECKKAKPDINFE